MTLIVEPDPQLAATLAFALGSDVGHVDSLAAVGPYLDDHPDEVAVVVGPELDLYRALDLAHVWQFERPHLGMVLLRRRVDVQLLGDALRAGVREVLGPEDLAAVVAAVRRSVDLSRRRLVQDAAPGGGERRTGRVVTVFSAKGGCGKTTIATNLAAALAVDGTRKVCLLDLDLEFGDVAIAMQLVPHRTIVDVVPMAGTMDEHGIRSVLTPACPGVDAVLAPTSPGDAARVEPKIVPELLRVLRQMYDIVVVDTPPAMTEQVLAAFDTSDLSVLLATLDVPALKNLKVSLDTLDMLGYPKQTRLIVLNRADARVGLDVGDVEHTIGSPIAVQVPSSGDVPGSINRGRLIVLDQPAHPVSRAVTELAARVTAGMPDAAARPDARHAGRPGGLMSRLRRSGAR